MFEPGVFGKIRRGDYTILPFEANKEFSVSNIGISGGGYSYKKAYYNKKILPVSSSTNFFIDAPTSSDGSYNYINWYSINRLYYKFPNNPIFSLEGFDNTEKSLFVTASILSVPQIKMGDGIKKLSVNLTGSSLNLYDDGYNNLVDGDIVTSSFAEYKYLDLYLGFQDLYTSTSRGFNQFINGPFVYESQTIFGEKKYECRNIRVDSGIEINSTGSGAAATFISTSSIIIPDEENLSYDNRDNFSISFWLKSPASQSVTDNNENTIISKNSYIKRETIGVTEVYSREQDYKVNRNIIDSSLVYDNSDIYPYKISINNQDSANSGKITFRKSDGSLTFSLMSTSSISDNNFHHVLVSKSGSLVSLYVDGTLESTGSDFTGDSTNLNSLLIGAESLEGYRQFSGSIDELRFYNYAVSANNINSLSNNSDLNAYQTSKVGNVFYKRGDVVITSPINSYHLNLENTSWDLNYKGSYTIYEYEVLVRLPKNMYNRTMNATSKRSIKSNEYLPDFTGSLKPYATTVGLYNKNFELVAVGKLARPLKMREDVDMNIIVKIDY